jgi:hypothetical protein
MSRVSAVEIVYDGAVRESHKERLGIVWKD